MSLIKLLSFSFIVFIIKLIDFSPSNLVSPNKQIPENKVSVFENVIFQSMDKGKSWQDISKGLPETKGNFDLFAQDKQLFMYEGNEMFQHTSNSSATKWTKAYTLKDLGEIEVCKSGLFAIKYDGEISKKQSTTNTWVPIFPKFQEKNLRTIFETSSGAFLIGSDNGLFKSTNDGETWKRVLNNGWVIKMVESKGVLIATNQNGIIRSTDDGESWNIVVSEGGVGIDVSSIESGFVAITYNTNTKSRRVRASYDAGKTWQAIDADLPAHDLIANIVQVDNYLFCGHPKGIFKSSDKGKNWKLIKPAIGDKVFNIYSFGNVIYAIPRVGGC